MEVKVKTALVKTALVKTWLAFEEAVADFFGETAFRIELAAAVLMGILPREEPRRWWSRSAETPVLVDITSMSSDRLIASLIVYPVLEEPAAYALGAQDERVEQIKESFARVCADLAWDTRFETYDLMWNPSREVWTTLDDEGDAVDGRRLEGYAQRAS